MHCVKILKQSQASEQIIAKHWKHAQVLHLVAHIESIFISAYYKEKKINALLYIGNIFIQFDI